jgi:hypothetical protein
MTIGGSLAVVAVGAILRYAIEDSWNAVDLEVVGLILMIVGAIGFVVGLIALLMSRHHAIGPSGRPPVGRL